MVESNRGYCCRNGKRALRLEKGTWFLFKPTDCDNEAIYIGINFCPWCGIELEEPTSPILETKRRRNYMSEKGIFDSGDYVEGIGKLYSGYGRDKMSFESAWRHLMVTEEKPFDWNPPRYFENFTCDCEKSE